MPFSIDKEVPYVIIIIARLPCVEGVFESVTYQVALFAFLYSIYSFSNFLFVCD